MILGAVLAGGKSSRFGSDKALAEIAGHTLIAQAVDALAGWCDHVVVVGRETAPAPTLPDWMMLALGKLCLHHELWGKAQSYLDASNSLKASRAAYTALAQLAVQLQKHEDASRYSQLAMRLD